VNPFEVLGLTPTMDLDVEKLETRYLELSRQTHPDYHRDSSTDEQLVVLGRAADLNDAYRELADPFERARVLIELGDPEVMARTQQLSGAFLMTAMELAEEVAESDSDAETGALRERIQEQLAGDLDALREYIAGADWQRAAVALHQSRYYRKALHDLEERT